MLPVGQLVDILSQIVLVVFSSLYVIPDLLGLLLGAVLHRCKPSLAHLGAQESSCKLIVAKEAIPEV